MSLVKWIDFPAFSDPRGSLVAIEADKNIPFEIKRVYYIYATKQGTSRGFHAHKALQQVAVCIAGHCTMLLDNGNEQARVILNSPEKGIFIGNMIWREMHDFSPDCILLVLANEFYQEADYIRDHDKFKKIINSRLT